MARSKKVTADDLDNALIEQTRAFARARREGYNRGQFRHMQALLAHFEAVGEIECKTIGNGNPTPYHCFACTWLHLRREVAEATRFWAEEKRRNEALS